MLDEFGVLLARRRRSKDDPDALRAQLIAAGAQVMELRPLARISPMPFTGLRPLPAFYEIRSTHEGRRGCWYVRTGSDSSDPDWVWHDADGDDTSPLPKLGPSVQGDPTPISWAHDWILLGVAGLIVATIVIWFAF